MRNRLIATVIVWTWVAGLVPSTMKSTVELSAAEPASAAQVDLEPYLKSSLPDLVAQVHSDQTPYVLKRRALARIVRQYPAEAADALVPFLDHYGASLNEYVGELLFQLGRPNTHSEKLIARIEQGRTKWTLEQTVAFSQAVSWPGNKAALAVLRRMIDAGWDTQNAARLCIARIEDTDGPRALLALPTYLLGSGSNYRSEGNFPERVRRLLRTLKDPRSNERLLLDGDPAKAHALWDQRGLYALAWPGNRALADAYVKCKDPYTKFHIAAARTQDERCMASIRKRLEKEAEELLNQKPEKRNVRFFYWIAIAGAESANAETAPLLANLLTMVEEARIAEEASLKAAIERDDPLLRHKRPLTDSAAYIREAILRGLCIRPNPEAPAILAPYTKDPRYGYLAGLALLRAGHPEGLEQLMEYWLHNTGSEAAAEAFVVYTAADVLPHSTFGVDRQHAMQAKSWYAKHKDDESLRDRVVRVNKSGLSEELVEPLKIW